MKLLFCIFIHIGVLLHVKGEYFEFAGINGTCILLSMDATFNLTYKEGNKTEIAEKFDLNNATVVNSSSVCGDTLFRSNSLLTVRLSPSGEQLQFTFQRQFSEIRMRVALFLNPIKHFSDVNNTLPVEMKDYNDLHVGHVSTSNYSYVCHSEQELRFLFNLPFLMTMSISNIQAQAYNVTNDTFGPAIECAQDPTTTPNNPLTSTEPSNVTITTEHIPETTTVKPENDTTTHVPTSESTVETTTEPSVESTTKPHTETSITTAPITTPKPHTETSITTAPITTEPKPAVPKYVVKDKDIVCIVLEGNVMFEINYQKKDNTVGTAQVSVPYNADVEGNCHLNNTAQQVTLTFFNATWMLDIIIMKETQSVGEKTLSAAGNAYTWKKLKLSYIVDGHFINAKVPGSTESAETYGAFESLEGNTDGSFKCKAEENFNIGKDVKIKLSKMQYRAFGNTKSADFTDKDVLECAADTNNNDNGVDKSTLGIVLGCVFGGLAVIILVAGGVWYYRKKRSRKYDSL